MCDQDKPLCEIEDFTAFLEKCLGQKVLGYKLRRLTKPGDNYGSIMQSVDVKVDTQNRRDKSETLHLVSKSAVTNPFLIKLFQPSQTFVKETHFYSDVIPALEHFLDISNVPEEERVDAFIRCPGSRISLNPNAVIADADAVLLLENITFSNYFNEDRRIGFDTETTLAILKTLAQVHALFIAMKRIKPDLFSASVKPYLQRISLDADDGGPALDSICEELKFIDGLNVERKSEIEKQMRVCEESNQTTVRGTDSPFATIVHRDLWTNNIMIKRSDVDGCQIKVKFYDFQLYLHESFACDLIFFLFTSVRCNDLTKNFELFITQYHSEFVRTLKSVNCPEEDYTYEKMWNEIREKTKFELLHSLFMVKIVTADESSAPPSLDEFTPDTFFSDEKPPNATLCRWKCILDVCKENALV